MPRTVHCPKCQGADIREKNTAYAELPVETWNFDEETGNYLARLRVETIERQAR